MGRSVLLLCALATGQLFLLPVAEACSPPFCSSAYVVPADDVTVPANVPAFFYRPPSGTTSRARPEDVRLLDDVGQVVPVSVIAGLEGSGYRIVSGAALSPGRQYRLRFPNGCTGGAALPTLGTVEHRLAAGEAMALPTTVGAGRVTGHRIGPH